MARHVAFLRALNVGGRIVKMDRLRAVFGDTGFTNVETFIASGNVLFDSASRSSALMEKTIEATLRTALGYEVPTLVRPLQALASIVEGHPFEGVEDAHTILVGFLRGEPAPATVEKLALLQTPTDTLHVSGSQLYWWCRTRQNETKITNVMLERAMAGSPVTFRNITTVRRLAAKA